MVVDFAKKKKEQNVLHMDYITVPSEKRQETTTMEIEVKQFVEN